MSPPHDEREGANSEGNGGLARRFLVGGLYVGFGSWTASLLNFAINLGVARLLGPEVWGFYAFVFAINEFLNIVGAFSISAALIQAPETSQRHQDTATAISALLGAVALIGAAAVASWLYGHHSPMAAWFLVILGVTRLIELVGSIPYAILERALEYRAVALIAWVSTVLPALAALALAWFGAGAWSLLTQHFLVSFMILVLAGLRSSYRFRGAVDREVAGKLMHFSRSVFVARSLEIGMERADRFAIGAAFGDLKLGLYNQARTLSESGYIAARPVTQLAFNLYSRLQDDPPRLARGFSLVNHFLVRLLFLGVATLLVYPQQTIRLLLGDDWLGAAPILGWLALYAGFFPLFENLKWLLYGRGMAARVVWLRLVQLLLFLLGIALAIALDDVHVVAMTLLWTVLLGVVLAWRMNGELLRGTLGPIFLGPCLVLAATVALFWLPPVAERLALLPFWLLPFLPPAVYAGLTLLAERTSLLRELRLLAGLLRAES
ncbi:MAG: oligosaccharide flippase family protein [Deltaproteobacteria bacterium]|nr:oligosaccharide flippase family protein [Deltaproteobacteria bacterium]MBW2418455.1 oligosaccharide flippase family protein [Deltaproteobacteria bacterium]